MVGLEKGEKMMEGSERGGKMGTESGGLGWAGLAWIAGRAGPFIYARNGKGDLATGVHHFVGPSPP